MQRFLGFRNTERTRKKEEAERKKEKWKKKERREKKIHHNAHVRYIAEILNLRHACESASRYMPNEIPIVFVRINARYRNCSRSIQSRKLG